jgi:uncharacterized protein (TIGR04255 family)
MALTRPTDLPEFANPPLNEMLVGIQFAQPLGYRQIRAGEVWALFRKDYPHVEEQPPLGPQFEAFGLPQNLLNFQLMQGASHDRFWFLSPNKDELIQFQQDRLLHNWRKVGEGSNVYPRFGVIIDKFEAEARQLEAYMATLEPQTLKINQAEVTYINHIPCDGAPGMACLPAKWLTLFDMDKHGFEDFNTTFRRRVLTNTGQPHARLLCQVSVATLPPEKRIIQLNLTFRGAPQGDNIDSAIEFLYRGRQMIVEFFTQITTEDAHKAWGRR